MKAAPGPSRMLRAEEMLARAPVAFAITEGPQHDVVYANPGFRRLGSEGEIALGPGASARASAADLTVVLDRVFRTGRPVHHLALDSADDPVPAWRCSVWPVEGGAGVPTRLVVELEDVSVAEDERAWQRALSERLILGALREQDLAREANDARQRAQFLARVSRDLATTLDESSTRDTVRHLTLPRPGSWTIVDLVEPDGSIHRLPVTHPDPARQDLARSLEALWPPSEPATPERDSARAPVMIGDESGAALLLAAHGEENLRLLREIGFGALLVVPIIVHARVQGTMTFVSAPGDAVFTSDEIALAVDLAARCGLALDNARLYRLSDGLRLAAELANQSKVQFLSSMSHELRTPLNAIGGFAELLEMGINGPVTDEQRTALARIKATQRHLLELITEVLTFARIEAGRIEYHHAEVPMSRALGEISDMLQNAVAQAGMALVCRPAEADCVVWADPVRVRQILMNLVMNAIKYAKSPGGTITISAVRSGGVVTTTVSDLGPGIPQAKLEAIFEPFEQLSAGLADRREGVGLGLAISRDLARAMAGDLSVESTPDVGTRFALTLPLARSA